MTNLCSNCDFENPPGMRFCGNCGARLDEATPPAEAKQQILAALSPEQLNEMMDDDLRQRLEQAKLEAVDQRREVTVMFVDLSSYTSLSTKLDIEDTYALIQQYTSMLVESVYQYGGTVDKFTGDGLMALFGAPIAYENNAERAVRSAIDMQAGIKELSQRIKEQFGVELQIRIGLHAGAVVVGRVGKDYTAIGDTVNLAQRLETAAIPGSTLVSQSVYQQTKSLFDYKYIPRLILKGISDPVPGYQVIKLKRAIRAAHAIDEASTQMVGRVGEMKHLLKMFSELSDEGKGHFVLVTGEAGIGKSRLTLEIKKLIEKNTVRYLEGHSMTYRRSLSYWIFLEVFRDYLGVTADTAEARVQERLVAKVTESVGEQRVGEVLPYLEHMMGLAPSDPDAAQRIRYLDAVQLRQQIFLAVRDLLVAEAQRTPLLIFLEDLHWADESSLDLLLFLLNSVQSVPLMIYGTSRSDASIDKMIAQAEKQLEDQFVLMPLANLSPAESEQLILHLLELSSIPDELREQVVQRAAGIPLYLEEVLRVLIEDGLIQRRSNTWQIASDIDIASASVPDTLQRLILARFDRCDEKQRQVLQLATAIGRYFNISLLDAVTPTIAAEELNDILHALAEREFIFPQADGGEGDYFFKHAMLSDVIYGTLIKNERSEMHGQIGEAIETLYADQLDNQIDLLARHYSWSFKLDRALYYLTLAGQRSANDYANQQARQHFEQALEILPKVKHPPRQAINVQMGLGDVLQFIGDYEAARVQYENALRAVPENPPGLYAKERSALERKLGRTYERVGDYMNALMCMTTAYSALDDSLLPAPTERAEILHDIGWLHFRQGKADEAHQLLLEAMQLVEDSTAYDVQASIYNRLAGVYYVQGKWTQTVEYVRKSIDIRESLGKVAELATSLNNLSVLESELGDLESAHANLLRSHELKTRLGEADGIAMTLNNLGMINTRRGELEEAERCLNGALDFAQQINYLSLLASIYMYFGELYTETQDWERAKTRIKQGIEIFDELGINDQLVNMYRIMGVLSLRENATADEADRWNAKIDEVFETTGTKIQQIPITQGEYLRFRGMLATRHQDWEMAHQYFTESKALFETLDSHYHLAHTAYQLGLLAEAQGQSELAQTHFQEASTAFQRMGAKLFAQRASEALSRQGQTT